MDQKKFIFVAVVALLSVSIPLLAMNNNQESFESNQVNSSEVKTTDDGTRYTVHPSELIQGCPGMDCIPSIDNPDFESREEADEWMRSEDLVIGLEVENESKAYPLRILNKHEIVNDRVAGEPVVVTYCPLCRSGVTYSREVNGEILEFGVSGKLRNANLIMYDRGTETYWSQIGGNAIIGPRTPQELQLKFSSITEWKDWKKGHPDTEVLSRKTGIYPVSSYDSNPYSGYAQREGVGFDVQEVDGRLRSKELVHGISIENGSKAYPETAIENERVIQDSVNGEPIIIFKRPDDGSVTAYSRKINGETLEFTLQEDALVDQNGDRWSFNGEKIGEEEELRNIVPRGFYWFAWSKFHPETKVYKTAE